MREIGESVSVREIGESVSVGGTGRYVCVSERDQHMHVQVQIQVLTDCFREFIIFFIVSRVLSTNTNYCF